MVVGTFLHIKERIHEHRYGTPEEQAEARYQAALKKYDAELADYLDRDAPLDEHPYPPSRCEFK